MTPTPMLAQRSDRPSIGTLAACFDLASTITMSSVAARTRTGPVLPAGGVGDVTVAVYLAPLLPPVEEPPHR